MHWRAVDTEWLVLAVSRTASQRGSTCNRAVTAKAAKDDGKGSGGGEHCILSPMTVCPKSLPLKMRRHRLLGSTVVFCCFLMSKVPASHPHFSACHLPVCLSLRTLWFTFYNVHYWVEKFTSKFTLNSIR